MKNVKIIIPTYNEKSNIAPLLKSITKIYTDIQNDYNLELIFVDDNSPDKTADEILQQKKEGSYKFSIHLIQRQGKLGLGTAYIRGFKEGLKRDGDILIQMDADLSHDPEAVPAMLNSLKGGNNTESDSKNIPDFIIGSRYIKGGKLPKWSISRKLISRGGNLYTRIILGFRVHDWTGGFNGYTKEVLQKIELDKVKSNGYSFQIEMKYKAIKKGFRPGEIPIEFHDRTSGQSKFSKKIFIEAFINAIKLRFGLL